MTAIMKGADGRSYEITSGGVKTRSESEREFGAATTLAGELQDRNLESMAIIVEF